SARRWGRMRPCRRRCGWRSRSWLVLRSEGEVDAGGGDGALVAGLAGCGPEVEERLHLDLLEPVAGAGADVHAVLVGPDGPEVRAGPLDAPGDGGVTHWLVLSTRP